MKISQKTDPFTGLEFEVIELDNKNLIINSPFYKTFTLEFNEKTKCYSLPAKLFNLNKNVSLKEASEFLNVSKMQVSRLCSDGTLKSAKINNNLVINYKSLVDYKQKRVKNVRNVKSVVANNPS